MFKSFYFKFFSYLFLLSCLLSYGLNENNTKSGSNSFSDDFIYPTDTTAISSSFGYRELYGKKNFHSGIDFPMPKGSNVYATNSGYVKSCGFVKGYGISITIVHPNNYISLYAHLDENVESFVKLGQKVSQGQIIANVGPKYLSNGVLNGLTTGPHLHFTVYNEKGELINPLSLNLRKN